MFPWNSLFSFQKNSNQKDFLKNMQQSDVQTFIEKVFTQVIPENMQGMTNQANNPFQKDNKPSEHPLH